MLGDLPCREVQCPGGTGMRLRRGVDVEAVSEVWEVSR